MQQAQKITARRPARQARPWTVDRIAPVLMILPSAIAIGIFVYGFIAWTGWVSLVDWRSFDPDFTFIGLRNYGAIFTQQRFQTDIRNTVVFTLFFLIGCLSIGLLLAVMVDSRIKGEAIFRSIFIFPMALSFIVTGVVWQWIFAPGTPGDPTGINLLLQRFGLPFYQDWSISPRVVPGWRPAGLRTRLGVPLAMIPLTIAAVWQMSGFTMAMYLAGLRGIPEDLREAARVDGASEWQVFRRITLPLLAPVTLSAVIILGHISLKIFDLILTMTGGGPGNATDVPGIFMYEITFKANKFSQGAAAAVVMLLMVAVLIVPYLVSNARSEVDR
ncbi:MAG TPA: sugar ABC transporter permease [Herpetosiphonaceae bacterium]|nr:sugar ABC transporter permease [Herpetosiphonaceae bacterium]